MVFKISKMTVDIVHFNKICLELVHKLVVQHQDSSEEEGIITMPSSFLIEKQYVTITY